MDKKKFTTEELVEVGYFAFEALADEMKIRENGAKAMSGLIEICATYVSIISDVLEDDKAMAMVRKRLESKRKDGEKGCLIQ